MALFRRKGNTAGNGGGTGGTISSILAKDLLITGELRFKGKARLDGTLEGNIKGEHLVLSESGRVHGDLELVSLICHGTIEGNITAQEVTAHRTASVHGNLAAASLTVEPGAKLHGEILSAPPQRKPVAGDTSSPPKPPADPN